MITITGKARKIKKGNHRCPDDGIHRKKNSGRIRGFWAAEINNVYIYYGNWSYYIKLDNDNNVSFGCKVFYSFKFNKTTKTRQEATVTFDMMSRLKEFCPEVYYIDEVKTDIVFPERLCMAISPVIYMQHVYYPERAWLKFAKGKPYNWNADEHRNHSKSGFIEFRRNLEDHIKSIDYDFDSLSIGNIVWCTKQKRWYLVDVR